MAAGDDCGSGRFSLGNKRIAANVRVATGPLARTGFKHGMNLRSAAATVGPASDNAAGVQACHVPRRHGNQRF